MPALFGGPPNHLRILHKPQVSPAPAGASQGPEQALPAWPRTAWEPHPDGAPRAARPSIPGFSALGQQADRALPEASHHGPSNAEGDNSQHGARPHPQRSVGIDSHRFWRAALVPPASGEPRPRGVTRPGPGAKDPGIGVLHGPLMGSAWEATPSVAPTPREAAAGPLAATRVEHPSWDSRGCFGNWSPGAASSSPTGAGRGSLPVVPRVTTADPAGPGDVLSVGTGVGQLGW